MMDLPSNMAEKAKERISDPILSTFALSFLISNWKFFYLLLKSNDTNSLNMLSLAISELTFISTLVIPAIAVFLYVLIFPFFKLGALRIQIFFRNLEIKIKNAEYNFEAVLKKSRDFDEKETQLREQLLSDYKYFLQYKNNDAFLIYFTKYDESVEEGEFYTRDGDYFKVPQQYDRNLGLYYIIKKIRKNYILYATVPSFIPLPVKLRGSSKTEIFLMRDGTYKYDDMVDDKQEKSVTIARISDTIASIKFSDDDDQLEKYRRKDIPSF